MGKQKQSSIVAGRMFQWVSASEGRQEALWCDGHRSAGKASPRGPTPPPFKVPHPSPRLSPRAQAPGFLLVPASLLPEARLLGWVRKRQCVPWYQGPGLESWQVSWPLWASVRSCKAKQNKTKQTFPIVPAVASMCWEHDVWKSSLWGR